MRTMLARVLVVVLAASSVRCAPTRSPSSTTTVTAATATTAAVPPERILSPVVEQPMLLSRATTWALALDPTMVYFGDAATNTLRAVPKLGGPVTTIGKGAPWGIALTRRSVVWIAAPGNVVLQRRPPPYSAGGTTEEPVEVLRTGGVFAAIAAADDDVFVSEITGDEERVVRIHDGTSTPLASFEHDARAIAVDDRWVYVQTDDAIRRVPRGGGKKELVAQGFRLSRLAVDDEFVYTTAELGPTRALARAPKSGGSLEIVEPGVRDAPIALFGKEAFYLDISQPTLRRVDTAGGPSLIVAEAPALSRLNALLVDSAGMFAGTAESGGGSILAFPVAP